MNNVVLRGKPVSMTFHESPLSSLRTSCPSPMYASTTPTDDGLILWYPERKFFLLGRVLR